MKKPFIVAGFIIVCLVIGFIFTKNGNIFEKKIETKTPILWLTEIKDTKYVGQYIGTEIVDNKKIFSGTGTAEQNAKANKKDDEDAWKLAPYIRVLCTNYTKVFSLVKSSTFRMVQKEITTIKGTVKNKDNFLYVTLPEIVSVNCNNNDKGFTDSLIRYLQSDYTDIAVLDAENIKKFVSYIDNISFDGGKPVSIERLKTDKEYFKEVFFKDRLAGLEDVYFAEYAFMKNETDADFFKHFSVLSLEERNQILERTVWKLSAFLKTVEIKGMTEFRQLILKNYGYGNNVQDMKENLIKKYKTFDIKAKEKGINLTLELVDIPSLTKFYTGDKFKLIQNDPELYGLFKEIGLGHLHHSIISDKFADSLNEGWSWKEQFGDSIIGNGIIRLGYMYLRETSKNTWK